MKENGSTKNSLHRKSIRLPGYDYSQAGGYFVTIATHKHAPVLGEIRDGEMQLSPCGKIAEDMLLQLPGRFPGVVLDESIIMPDHMHMIIILEERPGVTLPVLGNIVRALKSAVSYRCRRLVGFDQEILWQRNYYEHIIRDQRELDACREYILNNVNAWVEKMQSKRV